MVEISPYSKPSLRGLTFRIRICFPALCPNRINDAKKMMYEIMVNAFICWSIKNMIPLAKSPLVSGTKYISSNVRKIIIAECREYFLPSMLDFSGVIELKSMFRV